MKLFSMTAAVLATGLSFCCCNLFAQEDVRSTTTVTKATLVFAIGGLGDGSYNDQAWAGLQLAGTEFGVDVNYRSPGDPPDREAVLTEVANGNSDLIIATGTMFSDVITDLAESHTTQTFVCLDYSHSGPVPENLAGISFREHEGAFLVGMIAALKSRTGRIGFVGATPIPLIKRFEAGYTQGAKYAVPAVHVDPVYASEGDDGFNNPLKGEQMANLLIDGGADVIFHASGSTGLGVFKAAEDRGVMAIGVDKDQSSSAEEGVIITSMLKKGDVLVRNVVSQVVNGQFSGGRISYGLVEDVLGYVYDPAIIDQNIRNHVEDAKAKIIRGEISVRSRVPGETAATTWYIFE